MATEKSDLLGQLRIDRGSDPAPRGRARWIVALGAVAALVAVGAAWLWFARTPPVRVQVAVAQSATQARPQSSVLDASGYVTARRQATVSAKVTGRVREIHLEEGMRVEQGQVLAVLDDVEARAQQALARAQLEAAQSQLAETQTLLRNAQRTLGRQQELARGQLTSKQALEAAQTEAEALQARLASARRQSEVAARALAIADIDLDNTIVRAPFAGVVTVKAAQPGEIISPLSAGGGFTRTGIGTIVDMDSLEIEVDVNESYIQRVQPGQPVEAVLNAYPDWKVPARVIAIVPAADRAKATVKVRIALLEKDARIVPDMGVRVAFLEERNATPQPVARPGTLVPAGAVQQGDGQDFVWVVRDGRAMRQDVALGGLSGAQKLVSSGLAPGEQVIVDPPRGLEDGQAVSVESTAPQ